MRLQVQARPLSFSSAQEMRSRIELLPSPPRWKQEEIKITGGSTKEPLILFFRDGLECFRYLFGNPNFASYMDYAPRRDYANATKSERLYTEMMTGDHAWRLQVLQSISSSVFSNSDWLRLRNFNTYTGSHRDWRNTWIGALGLRQNPPHRCAGRQGMSPRVHVMWEYQEEYSNETCCSLLDDGGSSSPGEI